MESVYANENSRRSFFEDLCLHLLNPDAIIYLDYENLAIVRPVDRHADYDEITDANIRFHSPNAWWVYCLVGSIRFLAGRLPASPIFQWIGWERKNSLRFYQLKHVTKKCAGLNQNS